MYPNNFHTDDTADESLLPKDERPLKAPHKLLKPHSELTHILLTDNELVSSSKLDGNRGMCIAGRLITSNLNEPRNMHLHRFMEPMIQLAAKHELVFDFELYAPEETHHAVLSGVLNSHRDKLPESLGCYVFDCIPLDDWVTGSKDLPYAARLTMYQVELSDLPEQFIALEQRPVKSAEDIERLFDEDMANGYEGSMIRTLHIEDYVGRRGNPIGAWYKHGRATPNEHIIYKLKQFATTEGVIIGVVQRRILRNDWPREHDKKGNLKRPSNDAAYEPVDAVGAFIVNHKDESGSIITSHIGFAPGFPMLSREVMWNIYTSTPDNFLGKWVEFSHMPHGAKPDGKARFGRFVRFREDLESLNLDDKE